MVTGSGYNRDKGLQVITGDDYLLFDKRILNVSYNLQIRVL